MQSTTNCRRGDVILVPFPFTNLGGVKRRPALVVSSDEYNQSTNDIIVAQITGNTSSPPRLGDHMIAGWRQAGLLSPSRVRAKLATLHRNLVDRRLGQMPSPDMASIEANLRMVLQS